MRPWMCVPCDYRDPECRGGAYELFWCDGCRFGQLHPRPSDEEIARFYALADYYTHSPEEVDTASARRSFPERVLEHLAWRCDGSRPFHEHVIKALAEQGNRSICDVGCGNGRELQYAVSVGFEEVVGFDPDQDALEIASSRGLTVRRANAERLPVAEFANHFDVVLMNHVLEHTRDPLFALRTSTSILKPGGTIVVEVPNHRAHSLRQAGMHWPWLDVPRHLNFFTPRSLRLMSRLIGLRPGLVQYQGYTRQLAPAWRANEQRIRRAFAAARPDPDSARPRRAKWAGWRLLVRTAFGRPETKYDSVRLWSRRAA